MRLPRLLERRFHFRERPKAASVKVPFGYIKLILHSYGTLIWRVGKVHG